MEDWGDDDDDWVDFTSAPIPSEIQTEHQNAGSHNIIELAVDESEQFAEANSFKDIAAKGIIVETIKENENANATSEIPGALPNESQEHVAIGHTLLIPEEENSNVPIIAGNPFDAFDDIVIEANVQESIIIDMGNNETSDTVIAPTTFDIIEEDAVVTSAEQSVLVENNNLIVVPQQPHTDLTTVIETPNETASSDIFAEANSFNDIAAEDIIVETIKEENENTNATSEMNESSQDNATIGATLLIPEILIPEEENSNIPAITANPFDAFDDIVIEAPLVTNDTTLSNTPSTNTYSNPITLLPDEETFDMDVFGDITLNPTMIVTDVASILTQVEPDILVEESIIHEDMDTDASNQESIVIVMGNDETSETVIAPTTFDIVAKDAVLISVEQSVLVGNNDLIVVPQQPDADFTTVIETPNETTSSDITVAVAEEVANDQDQMQDTRPIEEEILVITTSTDTVTLQSTDPSTPAMLPSTTIDQLEEEIWGDLLITTTVPDNQRDNTTVVEEISWLLSNDDNDNIKQHQNEENKNEEETMAALEIIKDENIEVALTDPPQHDDDIVVVSLLAEINETSPVTDSKESYSINIEAEEEVEVTKKGIEKEEDAAIIATATTPQGVTVVSTNPTSEETSPVDIVPKQEDVLQVHQLATEVNTPVVVDHFLDIAVSDDQPILKKENEIPVVAVAVDEFEVKEEIEHNDELDGVMEVGSMGSKSGSKEADEDEDDMLERIVTAPVPVAVVLVDSQSVLSSLEPTSSSSMHIKDKFEVEEETTVQEEEEQETWDSFATANPIQPTESIDTMIKMPATPPPTMDEFDYNDSTAFQLATVTNMSMSMDEGMVMIVEEETDAKVEAEDDKDEWDGFATATPIHIEQSVPEPTVSMSSESIDNFIMPATPPSTMDEFDANEDDRYALATKSEDITVTQQLHTFADVDEFGFQEGEEDEEWDAFEAAVPVSFIAITTTNATDVAEEGTITAIAAASATNNENIDENKKGEEEAKADGDEWDEFATTTISSESVDNFIMPATPPSTMDEFDANEDDRYALATKSEDITVTQQLHTFADVDEFGSQEGEEDEEWDAFEAAVPVPSTANTTDIAESTTTAIASSSVTTTNDEDTEDKKGEEEEDDEWDAFAEAPVITATIATTTAATNAFDFTAVEEVAEKSEPEVISVVEAKGDINDDEDDDWNAFEEAGTSDNSVTNVPVTVIAAAPIAPISIAADNTNTTTASSTTVATTVTTDDNDDMIMSLLSLPGNATFLDTNVLQQWQGLSNTCLSLFDVPDNIITPCDSNVPPLAASSSSATPFPSSTTSTTSSSSSSSSQTTRQIAHWLQCTVEDYVLSQLPSDVLDCDAVVDLTTSSHHHNQSFLMAMSYDDSISRSQSIAQDEQLFSNRNKATAGIVITQPTHTKSNSKIGTIEDTVQAEEEVNDDELFGDFAGIDNDDIIDTSQTKSQQLQKPVEKEQAPNEPPTVTKSNAMTKYLNAEELSPKAYSFLQSLPDLSYVLIPH